MHDGNTLRRAPKAMVVKFTGDIHHPDCRCGAHRMPHHPPGNDPHRVRCRYDARSSRFQEGIPTVCMACTNGQELLIILPAAAATVTKARSAIARRLGRDDDTAHTDGVPATAAVTVEAVAR